MACVSIDFPAVPDISPLSLTPPGLPAVDLSANFCCKFQLISFAGYTPLGAAMLAIPGAAAAVALINQNLALVDQYIDAQPLRCPRD